MAKITNLIRGDSHIINVKFDNNGTPLNISGYTVYFTVNASKNPTDDSTAAIQKNITSHTNAALGQTTITLLPADTNSMLGNYFYDVQLKDPSGNVTSFKQDSLTVIADITRRTT